MEVKIGYGFSDIIFGMQQGEVVNILGIPDRINKEIYNHIVYYYNERRIKLKFDDEEDLKLVSVDSYSSEVIMYNQNIISKTKDEIRNLLKGKGYSEPEYEEYDTFETFFYKEICATFEFEFDKLRGIEFSPLYDKVGNERIWPKKI